MRRSLFIPEEPEAWEGQDLPKATARKPRGGSRVCRGTFWLHCITQHMLSAALNVTDKMNIITLLLIYLDIGEHEVLPAWPPCRTRTFLFHLSRRDM